MAHVRYKPIQSKRLFGPKLLYSDVNWNDFSKAVICFKEQLERWYLKPAETLIKTPHFAFAAMSICCTLVDTLAQYYYGVEEGTRKKFISFTDKHFPRFNEKLPTSIKSSHCGKHLNVSTYSEALYYGFRCGIIHEAHVKLYTAILKQQELVVCHETGFARYEDGGDCPCVIVDPHRFLARLKTVFEGYFKALLANDPKSEQYRDNFKKKFKWSYGIDIGRED